jgi:hypothetical protein
MRGADVMEMKTMHACRPIGFGALVALMLTPAALAAPLPTRVGQCGETTIKEVSYRLEGAPDSGSAVVFANGGYQVSYDRHAQITRSRRGDPVRMCLVEIPRNCPRGDNRGRIYKTTNLRTGESWELPDSPHSCGGA